MGTENGGEIRALTARETIAKMLNDAHEERMARAQAVSREPSFTIEQVAPPGKSGGFSFTITGPDPEAVAGLAKKWATEFPAPQPVAK